MPVQTAQDKIQTALAAVRDAERIVQALESRLRHAEEGLPFAAEVPVDAGRILAQAVELAAAALSAAEDDIVGPGRIAALNADLAAHRDTP